ncbi:MAG: V-type ATP synthase subunit E [Clostridia bacterium]|jgi:V/A-type H+-transporting ATPase subunit E
MPGIDRIYDKIINDAKEQADAKLYETSQRIDFLRGIIDEKLRDMNEDSITEAEKEARNILLRAEANRNLEGKKQLLSVRQDLLTKVFDKAHQSLMNLDDSKKTALYTKLISNCLEKGVNEIILNKSDKNNFGKLLIKQIENDLSDSIKVLLSDQEIEDDCGVIVKNGNIYSNSTFASLLKYKKQELEADVMKILFERGTKA